MGGRPTRPGASGDFQDLRKGAARGAGAALRFHLRIGRPRAAYPASAGRSENAGVRSPARVDRDRLACRFCTLVWTSPAAGVTWQVAAACGEGYGSWLLAGAAADVVGVDIDLAAIAHAALRYEGRSNLRFVSG